MYKNRGRQQLRTVTRTARRDRVEDSVPKPEESESLDEEINEKKPVYDETQSYNALLTLLSADHKDEPPRKQRKTAVEEETEIAGENFDEDEEDEEEVVSEDEEDDENDAFETHFNTVSDDLIENADKLIKNKAKWSIASKEKHEAYTSMLQVPPGGGIKFDIHKKSQLDQLRVKKRVCDAYEKAFSSLKLSAQDQLLASAMFSYKDVSFPYQKYTNTFYRKLYVAHALNHVYKTRDRILKNTDKIRRYQTAFKEGKAKASDEPELRDQGFTRPKVLILLPTRNACYEVVNMMIKLLGSEQQENRKKFKTQFYTEDTVPETKPQDFKDAFKGNSSDFFSIGLKFTRKSLKLYSSFYTSDIILASPIGLSMILESPDKKKRSYDFISSIEVLIVDRANAIEMQNWDHVNTVLKYVNKVPKEFHDADFSRIRMWSINDQAALLRQTLVFCEYVTPNVNNLMSKSHNLAGKLKFKPVVTSQTCIMNSIGLRIKQLFQRFDGGALPALNAEARFKFFSNAIIPSLSRSMSYDDGLLVYIPSYFDYLRVKEFMKSTKLMFDAIDEYSSQSKMSRTRALFHQGKIKVLLYTERLHHFRRFEISGVKNVLVYETPSNPLFYKELVKFIGKLIFKNEADLDLCMIKTLFSKWDAVSMERVVGNERAPILCNSAPEMYEFR